MSSVLRHTRFVPLGISVGLSLVLLLLVWAVSQPGGIVGLVTGVQPTVSPLYTRFQASQVTVDDLPVGWFLGGVQVKDVAGTESRFQWFERFRDRSSPWVNVSQEVLLYPSEQAASGAYTDVVNGIVPFAHTRAWVVPEGLAFTDQADQMVIDCLETQIDGMHAYSCAAIGLYSDMIVIMRGNVFDEQWLTMADFRAVLETADRRAAAAVQAEGP